MLSHNCKAIELVAGQIKQHSKLQDASIDEAIRYHRVLYDKKSPKSKKSNFEVGEVSKSKGFDNIILHTTERLDTTEKECLLC